jgi:hypothetical protein
MRRCRPAKLSAAGLVLVLALTALPSEAAAAEVLDVGLRAFAMLPLTQPGQRARIGSAFEMPFYLKQRGQWGLKLSLMSTFHKEAEAALSWWPPDGPDPNEDGVWEAGETARAVVGGQRMLAFRAQQVSTFGLSLALQREFHARPGWLRPYVGGGLVIHAIYSRITLRADEAYLLPDEAREDLEPKPTVLHVIPGLSLYGGLRFALGEVFALVTELGLGYMPVPTGDASQVLPAFQLRRWGYDLLMVRAGGGVEARF